MRGGSWVAVTGALLLGGVAAGCAEVREVAVRDLGQVAVVARDARGPVIYYNPERCVQVGRAVCAFERVHAQELVARGKVPFSRDPTNPYDTRWLSPQDVLQADCWAANELRGHGGGAAHAAVEFYRRQGTARVAPNYPPGAQRAAQILECLERF